MARCACVAPCPPDALPVGGLTLYGAECWQIPGVSDGHCGVVIAKEGARLCRRPAAAASSAMCRQRNATLLRLVFDTAALLVRVPGYSRRIGEFRFFRCFLNLSGVESSHATPVEHGLEILLTRGGKVQMKKYPLLLAAALAGLFLSGCASIVDGRPKIVTVLSNPPGAKVIVADARGNKLSENTTPASISLHAAMAISSRQNTN